MKRILCLFGALMLSTVCMADSLQWNLPDGLGSLQLPWKSTEGFYGAVRPIKGGLTQEIAGASLPVITIGKLKGGERILDGQLGAAGVWPVQSSPVNPYVAVGHDVAQDIPALSQYNSVHLNAALTYETGMGGWYWGGTLSYAPGAPSDVPAAVAQVPVLMPIASRLSLIDRS